MGVRMATKAVLFDLDDTLAPEETAVEAAFLATCEIAHRRHGIEPGAMAGESGDV